MKTLILFVFVILLAGCSNTGYIPAFEADFKFKSETAKLTYISSKYKIPSLFYRTNNCNFILNKFKSLL